MTKRFSSFVAKCRELKATGLTWAEVREDLGYDDDNRKYFRRMFQSPAWRALRSAERGEFTGYGAGI